jgi:DNA helicase HerA-like ATPase
MFVRDAVDDTLADIVCRLIRFPVDDKPITIIDLSGVPSEIVDVVVSIISRMIFDFALWSAEPQAAPVLLVCEEAHRYVPRDEKLGFSPTRRAITRIAMEGRKYGVSLCLVSNRPSGLSPTMLAQCNTIFALRMSNQQDHDFIRSALPE